MYFALNPADSRPVYQQIVDQVKKAVASGRLVKGNRLPPIRRLAEMLRVNRNTVSRAYMELERAGVVETRVGEGTFIAPSSVRFTAAERARLP